MKVLKPNEIPAQDVRTPLFTGGAVTRQTLLTPEMSQDFNLGIVNFSEGARNKMHTHTSDQVLFVTAGKGIIATETTQEVITVGDVVHIPGRFFYFKDFSSFAQFIFTGVALISLFPK